MICTLISHHHLYEVFQINYINKNNVVIKLLET